MKVALKPKVGQFEFFTNDPRCNPPEPEHTVVFGSKGEAVLDFLTRWPLTEASLRDISEELGWSYYHNAEKHLGNVCSRLVKAGLIERLKPGVFRITSAGSNALKHARIQVHP